MSSIFLDAQTAGVGIFEWPAIEWLGSILSESVEKRLRIRVRAAYEEDEAE